VAAFLGYIAERGKAFLLLGLVCGLVFEYLAQLIRPWLPELIFVLLFLTSVRIGPAVFGAQLGKRRHSLWIVLLFQLLVPLVVVGLCLWLDINIQLGVGLAVALLFSAPSVTGAPNFAILMGYAPEEVLRILILGVLLFPLTVMPVLLLSDVFPAPINVLYAAMKLAGAVLAAFTVAMLLRRSLLPEVNNKSLDGLASILLVVVVIGLMSKITPMLQQDPWYVGRILLLACALNLGGQMVAMFSLHRWRGTEAVGDAIQFGNRNIALFLMALPTNMADSLLVFIGCYQIPMYLTPLVMNPFYNRFKTL